jgi:hypothetical protein
VKEERRGGGRRSEGGEERRRAEGGEENVWRRREEGVKWPAPPILKFMGGKLSSGAPRHECATAIFFVFEISAQNLNPGKVLFLF